MMAAAGSALLQLYIIERSGRERYEMSTANEYPPGCLVVVATPIGNLDDCSPRACAALAAVDVIAAEDTRHSGVLLAHLGVTTPMTSLHEHNERAAVPALIERLRAGERAALISDAGTPLISDPGFVLVRAAREAGLPLRSVPGPCAAIAALAIAGLPSDRFVFEGFLPARTTARRKRLGELAGDTRTLVFYESSHRIADTARDLAAVVGEDRQLTVARELTKLHEESVSLLVGQLPDWLAADDHRRRGEFVLTVAGAAVEERPPDHPIALDTLLGELLAAMPVRDAVKAAVRLTGAPRNHVYRRAVALGGGAGAE